MKRTALLLIFLSFFILANSAVTGKRPTLTITNRSGYPLKLRLTATDTSNTTGFNNTYIYNLTIPLGTGDTPVSVTFDLQPFKYAASLTFVEAYDPVYGYQCSGQSTTIDMTVKHKQVSVLPCQDRARARGDQYVTTFGNGVARKHHRVIRYPLNAGQTGVLHEAKPQPTEEPCNEPYPACSVLESTYILEY